MGKYRIIPQWFLVMMVPFLRVGHVSIRPKLFAQPYGLTFQEKLSDGTTTEFDAQVSVKRTGGGVNGVIDVEATMSVQSDLKVTDPV